MNEAQRRFGHESDAERALRLERRVVNGLAKQAKKIDRAYLSTFLPERSKSVASVDNRLRRAWRAYELERRREPCSM